jgi:hypothetical protein
VHGRDDTAGIIGTTVSRPSTSIPGGSMAELQTSNLKVAGSSPVLGRIYHFAPRSMW